MSDPRIAIKFEAITGDFFTAINAVQNSVNSLSKTLGGVSGNFRSFGSEIAQSQTQAANAVKYAQGTILDQFGNVIPVIKQEGQAAQVTGDKLVQLGAKAEATAQKTGRLRTGVNNTSLAFVSFGRVLQDAPYGFNAIANNLTELPAAFAQVSAAAKSTGKSITSVILSSLTGPAGIAIALSVVVAALQFASLGFDNWTRGFTRGKEQLGQYKEKIDGLKKSVKDLNEIRLDSASTVDTEAVKISSLTKIISDSNKPYEDRKRALEELKKINKAYFGDLTLESATVATLIDRTNNYTKALYSQAVVKGILDEITKFSTLKRNEEKNLIDLTVQTENYKSALDLAKNSQDRLQRASSGGSITGISSDPGKGTVDAAQANFDNADKLRKKSEGLLAEYQNRITSLVKEIDLETAKGLTLPSVNDTETNKATTSVDNAFEKLRQRLSDSLEEARQLGVSVPETLVKIPLSFEIPSDKKAQSKLKLAVNEQIKDITDYTRNEVDLRRANAKLEVEILNINIAKERDALRYLKGINQEYTQEYRDRQATLLQLETQRIAAAEKEEINALIRSGERNTNIYAQALNKIKAKYDNQRLNVTAELDFKPTVGDFIVAAQAKLLEKKLKLQPDIEIPKKLPDDLKIIQDQLQKVLLPQQKFQQPLNFVTAPIPEQEAKVKIKYEDLPPLPDDVLNQLISLYPVLVEDPAKLEEMKRMIASLGYKLGPVKISTELRADISKNPVSGDLLTRLNNEFSQTGLPEADRAKWVEKQVAAESAIKKFYSGIGAVVTNEGVNIGALVAKSLEGLAETIGAALINGGSIGDVLQQGLEFIIHAIGGVISELGNKLIELGTQKILLDTLFKSFFTMPGAAQIAIGIGLAALGAAFKAFKTDVKKAKPFAEGGIVTGPTLALVGEAGSEAIIPLSKFDQVVGGRGAMDVFVTGQLSGEMIYLQQQRAINRRDRFV